MPPRKAPSERNTKQELLDAYNGVLGELETKRAQELNPEKRQEAKKTQEAVATATSLTPETAVTALLEIRGKISQTLSSLADQIAAETGKFVTIQNAIKAKESEVRELFGIEKAATSLAALIEAERQKSLQLEEEYEKKKAALQEEVETARTAWTTEKRLHEQEIKDREASEKKTRERQTEEFTYNFNREKQLSTQKLKDELMALEKELAGKKEAAEKQFTEREKILHAAESELAELRRLTAAHKGQIETAVSQAVQSATDRLKADYTAREALAKSQADGERKVLEARIKALEQAVAEQTATTTRATTQLETAYQKVQEIAIRAVEGSQNAKQLSDLQKLLAETGRKTTSEKP